MNKDNNEKITKKLLLLALIIVVGGPFIINSLFKLETSNKFLVAEWSAGDMLSYYGSVLVGLATVYLSYVAITQAKFANDLNKDLLFLSKIEREVYVDLNLDNINIVERDGMKHISLEFKNITKNPIIESSLHYDNRILDSTLWSENNSGTIISNFHSIIKNDSKRDKERLLFDIFFETDSNFILLPFQIKLKSIYRLETKQNFNIVVFNNCITYEME